MLLVQMTRSVDHVSVLEKRDVVYSSEYSVLDYVGLSRSLGSVIDCYFLVVRC